MLRLLCPEPFCQMKQIVVRRPLKRVIFFVLLVYKIGRLIDFTTKKLIVMKRILIVLIFSLPWVSWAQLNGSLQVSGRVVNDRGDYVPGVSVLVKGTTRGSSTDSLGYFTLVVNQKFPIHLVISSIGFGEQEIEVRNSNSNLRIQLSTQSYLANAIVVTASRYGEKLMRSPVTE